MGLEGGVMAFILFVNDEGRRAGSNTLVYTGPERMRRDAVYKM